MHIETPIVLKHFLFCFTYQSSTHISISQTSSLREVYLDRPTYSGRRIFGCFGIHGDIMGPSYLNLLSLSPVINILSVSCNIGFDECYSFLFYLLESRILFNPISKSHCTT